MTTELYDRVQGHDLFGENAFDAVPGDEYSDESSLIFAKSGSRMHQHAFKSFKNPSCWLRQFLIVVIFISVVCVGVRAFGLYHANLRLQESVDILTDRNRDITSRLTSLKVKASACETAALPVDCTSVIRNETARLQDRIDTLQEALGLANTIRDQVTDTPSVATASYASQGARANEKPILASAVETEQLSLVPRAKALPHDVSERSDAKEEVTNTKLHSNQTSASGPGLLHLEGRLDRCQTTLARFQAFSAPTRNEHVLEPQSLLNEPPAKLSIEHLFDHVMGLTMQQRLFVATACAAVMEEKTYYYAEKLAKCNAVPKSEVAEKNDALEDALAFEALGDDWVLQDDISEPTPPPS